MATTRSIRTGTLAAMLLIVALALALALSPQAGARAGRAACTHAPGVHSKHHARPCTGEDRTGHRSEELHTHSKTAGHRPKHSLRRHHTAEGGQGAGETEEEAEAEEAQAGEHEAPCEAGGAQGCEEEGSEEAA